MKTTHQFEAIALMSAIALSASVSSAQADQMNQIDPATQSDQDIQARLDEVKALLKALEDNTAAGDWERDVPTCS